MAPTSLFTYIIDTNIVSSLISFFSASKSTTPYSSTGRYTTLYPIFSKYFIGFATEECSTFVVITLFPLLLFASTEPIIAILLDSVPPDVKYISLLSTFKISAIQSLASFIYFSASTPIICIEDGFP